MDFAAVDTLLSKRRFPEIVEQTKVRQPSEAFVVIRPTANEPFIRYRKAHEIRTKRTPFHPDDNHNRMSIGPAR